MLTTPENSVIIKNLCLFSDSTTNYATSNEDFNFTLICTILLVEIERTKTSETALIENWFSFRIEFINNRKVYFGIFNHKRNCGDAVDLELEPAETFTQLANFERLKLFLSLQFLNSFFIKLLDVKLN